MKVFIHLIFIILLGLNTIFGVGPVLMADGTVQERLLTSAVVIIIYIILVWLYRKALKWINSK